MTDVVSIPFRFRGPPGSGNGGYSCGVAAELLGGTAEVTLKSPPPLDRPLAVDRADGVVLKDGDAVVVVSRRAELVLDVPTPPSFERAEASSRHYTGFEEHAFPECFTCGPARAPGDGLRIFAGAEPGQRLVAAPWVPHESLCDGQGRVLPAVLWAALDCPGYFAIGERVAALLGRMTGAIDSAVAHGERCVVVGWSLGSEGRKHHTATALFDASGKCVGRSKQVWVRLS